MPAARTVRMALVGGGMFGGDVVLRTIADLERCGVAPYLGRVGLDARARELAPIELRLVAVGTRTEQTASRVCESYRQDVPGAGARPYWGEKPWEAILADHDVDIVFIATPDSLHYEPARAALLGGAHVMVEKPLTLHLAEADELLDLAAERGLVVGVDMHKRYDPCHRFIFEQLLPQIGSPLYGRAVLEEPLEVSTETFRWAATSNPFSYVGVHWVDLFAHGLGCSPASLHAVGQKRLLVHWDREGGSAPVATFDSMQVAVDYQDGLHVEYVNNWINPAEFEGAVNQELELCGTRGKVEFDQQYRGLRATITGVGSKTYNPHFTRDVPRVDGAAPAYCGYGKDSIVVIVERALEVLTGLASRDEIVGTYPDIESARATVGIIEAATLVAERNLAHLAARKGTPATARFGDGTIDLVDPAARGEERIYDGEPF